MSIPHQFEIKAHPNIYCEVHDGHIVEIMKIDSSSYLFPYYLENDRIEIIDVANTKKMIRLPAFIRGLDIDRNIIDLRFLYKNFTSTSPLIIVQGAKDPIIDHDEKKSFFSNIENSFFITVEGGSHVVIDDQHVFFNRVIESSKFGKSTDLNFKNIILKTDRSFYNFDYTNFLPWLKIKTFSFYFFIADWLVDLSFEDVLVGAC